MRLLILLTHTDAQQDITNHFFCARKLVTHYLGE